MTVGDPATQAAPTMAREPLAYEYAEEDDPPPNRIRWILPAAVLSAASVGLVVAVTLGMRIITTPTSSPSTVTVPSRTITLTQPDQDTAFLMDLDKTGIMYDAAGIAVHNARLVCKALAAGKTEAQMVDELAKFQEIAPSKAAPFVTIAVAHYCPRGPQD